MYFRLLIIRISNLIDYLIDKYFDLRHDLDTEAKVEITDLEIDTPVIKYIKKYQGTRNRVFHQLIQSLDINYSQYNFIDIGSGKGKALIMANQYSFKHIIGIELSKKLIKISRDNLAKLDLGDSISLIQEDASKYILPKGLNIIYLYNPFDEHLLHQFLRNNHFNPGDIIIYLNPRYHTVFNQYNFKRVVLRESSNFNKVALAYII